MGALSSVRRAASGAHANRPFITDCSAGLRTELSGVIFEQWVAKTANWLEAEFDVGVRLTVELRAHWLWPVLLAALDELEGAVVPAVGADALVCIGSREDSAVPVIAIHDHPMAMPFAAPLPAGHLDYFRLVRGGADIRSAGPPHDEPLYLDDAGASTAAELLALAPQVAAGSRIALHTTSTPLSGSQSIAALIPWAASASLVITDGSSGIAGERCDAEVRLD